MNQVTQKKFLFADMLCWGISMVPRKLPIVKCVQSVEELREACELLYRQYIKRGYCVQNTREMHFSKYMFLPESRTFIGKNKSGIYGTLSIFIDSHAGLPIDAVCSDKITTLRAAGAKIAEVGLLATEFEAGKSRKYSLQSLDKMLPLFSLFRTMFQYANAAGVTDLVISVHPRHRELYKFLGFSQLSSEVAYTGANGAPAVPMLLNFDESRRNAPKGIRNLFHNSLRPSISSFAQYGMEQNIFESSTTIESDVQHNR